MTLQTPSKQQYLNHFDDTFGDEELQMVNANITPPQNHGFDSERSEIFAVAKKVSKVNAENVREALKSLNVLK